MDTFDPLTQLRQLKGAPLSILVALGLVHQNVTAKWLSSMTGYSPNSITSALTLLFEMQLVTCNTHRSSWRLSDGTKQLPLIPTLPLSTLSQDFATDRKNCDLDAYLKATYLNKYEQVDIEGSKYVLNNPDRKNCDLGDHPDSDSDYWDCLALLHLEGIRDPKAGQILELDHVDYIYLEAHIRKARSENTDLPLLIHRIQCADPIPDQYINRSSERWRRKSDRYICSDCNCRPCHCDEE
jgi:hypothetical protein